MRLAFMTKRNANGNRLYICFDTDSEIYSNQCRYMIPDGVEVTVKAYREIVATVQAEGYERVDFI